MIHPTADVMTKKIGKDTRIWQYCVILKGAKIGKSCNICAHVFIENRVVVGNDVTIKSGVQLWDGIVIGNGAFVGPNATFTNDKYPPSVDFPKNLRKTTIGEKAVIGANSTILPGIIVGKRAIVGAGSVVTKNIPSGEIWLGNPAKFKRKRLKE